jgi:hypothetical protein
MTTSQAPGSSTSALRGRPENLSEHSPTAAVLDHLEKSNRRWTGAAVEIVEGLLLATVAVMTAWTGYQSALWNSRSAASYGQANGLHFSAQAAATVAGQQMLYDAATFNAWLAAAVAGNSDLEASLERRFRPEYRPAFEAWLATDPFHNPSAPAGPGVMPEYHNVSADKALALEREATAAVDAGNHSRHVADEYIKTTILLAVVLFLTALSQRFTVQRVRAGIIAVATVALVYAIYAATTIAV